MTTIVSLALRYAALVRKADKGQATDADKREMSRIRQLIQKGKR